MVDKRHGIFVAALVSVVAGLYACGSDSNDDGGGTTTPPPTASYTIRLASLDGAQEAPAVTTNAVGGGILAVDETTRRARGFVRTAGLVSVQQAHIHLAPRGTPGDVIVPLVGANDLWVVPDNTTLTPDQLTAFLAGNLYYNVHTTANPGGEIRGQIDKSGTVKLASADGAQETPPIATDARGFGILAMGASGAVAGFLLTQGLVAPTAAHVHLQARGTPGSVIVTLLGGPEVWVVPDGEPALDATEQAAFTAGNLYYQPHTPAHPGGEIRGQLDKSGTIRIAAMDGAQEVPAVATSARGAGLLAMGASGAVAGFEVLGGLTTTVAHVHQQARGVNGDVIVPLEGGGSLWVVPDGQAALSATQQSAFTAGSLYFNAHTAANAGGEIRGQLD